MRPFWKWLTLFAYARWSEGLPVKPVGVPGNRDPDYPCQAYNPRSPKWNDWGKCEGDGHYLCHKCAHFIGAESESDLIQLNI